MSNSAALPLISSRVSQYPSSVRQGIHHSGFPLCSSLTYFCPHGPKVSRTIKKKKRRKNELGFSWTLRPGWACGPIWALCNLLASTSRRDARQRGCPSVCSIRGYLLNHAEGPSTENSDRHKCLQTYFLIPSKLNIFACLFVCFFFLTSSVEVMKQIPNFLACASFGIWMSIIADWIFTGHLLIYFDLCWIP